MAKQIFNHHPDGRIIVNDVSMTLLQFMELEPDYVGLPAGQRSRLYVQGVRHCTAKWDTEYGAEFPWPAGDLYLAKTEVYRQALDAQAKASEDALAAVVELRPDARKFFGAIKTIYQDDPIALNAIAAKYPLMGWSIQSSNWRYAGALIKLAYENKDLTDEQYQQVKAAAVTHYIPVNL